MPGDTTTPEKPKKGTEAPTPSEERVVLAETEGAETANPKPKAPEERGALADKPAEAVATEIPDRESGKMHGSYLELTESEEIKPLLEKDRTTLGGASVRDIRYNPRLLKPEEKDEAPQTRRTNLKAETARRIAAYTSSRDGQWYTLNYSHVGGEEHLYEIGLGDILLDPDIQHILVDREGEIIEARRGVPVSGKHAGRQSFVDNNGDYVATLDGDRFKILSSENLEEKQWIETYGQENKTREQHKVNYVTRSERMIQVAESVERSKYKENITFADITTEDIQKAEEECNKPTSGLKVLDRQYFTKVLEAVAKWMDCPSAPMYAALYRECSFRFWPPVIGDGGLAVGMGQIHPPAWETARKNPKVAELLEQFVEGGASSVGRNSSIIGDLADHASLVKRGLEAVMGHEVHYGAQLTKEQFADARFHYHVPGYWSALRKGGKSAGYQAKAEAFYEKKKSLYYDYADMALQFQSRQPSAEALIS